MWLSPEIYNSFFLGLDAISKSQTSKSLNGFFFETAATNKLKEIQNMLFMEIEFKFKTMTGIILQREANSSLKWKFL